MRSAATFFLCAATCSWISISCVHAQSTDEDKLVLLKKLVAEMELRKVANADSRHLQDDPFPELRTTPDRSVSLGRTSRAPEPPKPIKEVRVYDLAELFAIAPNNVARGFVGWDSGPLLSSYSTRETSMPRTQSGGMGGMGGMGGGMGGMFNIGSNYGMDSMDDESWNPTPHSLMRVIEQVVEANWENNGGDEKMEWLGSSLLVNAFPDTHTLVQKLLDLLQSRWNSRVTFEVQLHWMWLSFAEEEQLSQLMVADEKSSVRSILKDDLNAFITSIVKKEDRPTMLHARIHCHNGQRTAWTSGTQVRTVETWERERGKLVPKSIAIHRGVACEVCPMLAHASDHATLLFDSRLMETTGSKLNAPKEASEAATLETLPRPDRDEVTGQSIATTVRLPVGHATILGSGTSFVQSTGDWQLVVVGAVDTVSPRQKK